MIRKITDLPEIAVVFDLMCVVLGRGKVFSISHCNLCAIGNGFCGASSLHADIGHPLSLLYFM